MEFVNWSWQLVISCLQIVPMVQMLLKASMQLFLLPISLEKSPVAIPSVDWEHIAAVATANSKEISCGSAED